VKFKRGNGYKEQKRLKHERAINKYTGKLEEKKNATKLDNKSNLLHYQEMTNKFDFESQLTRKRVTKRR